MAKIDKKAFGIHDKVNWINTINRFIKEEYTEQPTVLEVLAMCTLIEENIPLIDRYGFPEQDYPALLRCIIQEVVPDLEDFHRIDEDDTEN